MLTQSLRGNQPRLNFVDNLNYRDKSVGWSSYDFIISPKELNVDQREQSQTRLFSIWKKLKAVTISPLLHFTQKPDQCFQ